MGGEQEQRTFDWGDWGGMQPRPGCGCGCYLLIILAAGILVWAVRKPARQPVPEPAATAPVVPVEEPDPPPVLIDAEILIIGEGDDLTIIGAGEKEGVGSGESVEILRGEDVVGTGTVIFVLEETSGVKVVELRQGMQEGDRVRIRQGP